MPKLNKFSGLVRSLQTTKRYSDHPTLEVSEEYILEVVEEEGLEDDEMPPRPPPPPPGPATG